MSTTFPERGRARGFATAVIIGLLVLMAVLGTALVVISTTQQAGFALDLQGTRAYQAARSGAEWGINRVLNGTACTTVNGTTFTYAGNLAGFQVTLGCLSNTHQEVTTTVTMYTITATGCNLASGTCAVAAPTPSNYVERQLSVTVGSN
jgi:MSHA biogenesis protein MshP